MAYRGNLEAPAGRTSACPSSAPWATKLQQTGSLHNSPLQESRGQQLYFAALNSSHTLHCRLCYSLCCSKQTNIAVGVSALLHSPACGQTNLTECRILGARHYLCLQSKRIRCYSSWLAWSVPWLVSWCCAEQQHHDCCECIQSNVCPAPWPVCSCSPEVCSNQQALLACWRLGFFEPKSPRISLKQFILNGHSWSAWWHCLA